MCFVSQYVTTSSQWNILPTNTNRKTTINHLYGNNLFDVAMMTFVIFIRFNYLFIRVGTNEGCIYSATFGRVSVI